MTDRDQFFNNLFDDNARGQTDGFQRQLSYEDRIVRRVFNECGVKPPSWGQLVNMCRGETGTHEMSFSWFNGAFPRFPATLCGKRIGYCGYRRDDAGNKSSLALYQLTISDMLATKNNILVRAISKALHNLSVDPDRPFAFVFPIVRKFFVAHNIGMAPPQMHATMNENARVMWTFSSPAGGIMYVEPSIAFFNSVGSEWFEV